MTAPLRRDGRATDVPAWQLDGFTFRGDGLPDSRGRQWIVDEEKGWSAPAPRRTDRDPKPDRDGAFRGTSYAGARVVTLGGHIGCETPDDREDVENAFAAICSDGTRLYRLRRTTARYDQTIAVELDDDPLVEMVSLWTVKFSLQLAAPDPRKHDATWQSPLSTSAGTTTGGLEHDASGGLDYSGGGLDYGTPADPIPAQVTNYGTAPARPSFELRGLVNGLAAPTIVCAETADVVSYAADIAPGEVVYVNCDDFAARGVAAQSAVSSIRGDVSALLSVGLAWPFVAPGATGTYQLLTAGTSEALTVLLRSAWR